jgi:2',3'-cyclic-nucleotide 2'-phosphodiesterase / 3'-nucleotidase / 5'-nucleotidase
MKSRINSRRFRGLKVSLAALLACAAILPASARVLPPEPLPDIELTPIGTYASGIFAQGGAEIVAHDPLTQRLYVVNAQAAAVDVLDISNPNAPAKVDSISLLLFGGVANSVAVHNGLVAVAVEAVPKTDPGKVVFFDAALEPLSSVTVGALPDMLTFTHDGGHVLVANEAEPSGYGAGHVDPEGSVSVIDLRRGAANLQQRDVRTADFSRFNNLTAQLKAAGVRIFGPNATVAQDLEPEYITVSPTDSLAWVTLQENNAIGIIQIQSATVIGIIPLGLKDHNAPGNAFDPSDRDNGSNGPAIKIANWPVSGMYLPDSIASYSVGAIPFLVMANEGDAREWPGFREDVRAAVTNYILDPTVFPNGAALKNNAALGRLPVSSVDGDLDGDGDIDRIQSYGARSFTIRNTSGQIVFDSGDQFETILAALHAAGEVIFNASHDNNTFDARSPSKGPEPEGLALGQAFGHTLAFIGLERVGGLMVYDITSPADSHFVAYANNRIFSLGTAINAGNFATFRDLGPEGIIFIDASDSPNGQPLVVVGNEISGTTTIYQVNQVP